MDAIYDVFAVFYDFGFLLGEVPCFGVDSFGTNSNKAKLCAIETYFATKRYLTARK